MGTYCSGRNAVLRGSLLRSVSLGRWRDRSLKDYDGRGSSCSPYDGNILSIYTELLVTSTSMIDD